MPSHDYPAGKPIIDTTAIRHQLPYPSEIIGLGIKITLPSIERHLLLCLRSSMNDKNLFCWKSQETLASETGLSRSSICKAIKNLRKRQIINVNKKKRKSKMGFDNNEYSFNYPWDTSVSMTAAIAHMKNVRMSQQNAYVCIPEAQTCVVENINNKSSKKELKKSGNLQCISFDDEPVALQNQPAAHLIKTDHLKTDNVDEISHKNLEENYVLPKNFPPAATESDLDFFYQGSIPDSIDLNLRHGRRPVKLAQYTEPFRGTRHQLLGKYGKDYDIPFEKFWEDQCQDYYEKAIDANWKKGETPTGGFETIFKRACRAGVMHRCGFRPKSHEQREAEVKEKLRLEEEKKINEGRRLANESRVQEGKRLNRDKDNELRELICGKDVVYSYLVENGIIRGDSNISYLCLISIRKHIENIMSKYRLESFDDFVIYCGEKLDLEDNCT